MPNTAKSEAIRKAYGEYWEKMSPELQAIALRSDGFIRLRDCISELGDDFFCSDSIDVSNNFGTIIRPKSLQGIENYYSFVDIKGFENYEVNKLGVVISKDRIKVTRNNKRYPVKSQVMTPQIDNSGYVVFNLTSHTGDKKKFYLHRLIAENFIPNPENKPCVNHKDGVKYNNSIENLEWNTYQENNIHAFDTELQKRGVNHHYFNRKGEQCHNSKKVICMDTGIVFNSLTEASKHFKVSKSHISNILRGIKNSNIRIEYFQPIVKPEKPIY